MTRRESNMYRNNVNKKSRTFIKFMSFLFIVSIISISVILIVKHNKENEIYKEKQAASIKVKIEEKKEEKKLQIYKGTDRVIAVMIDNEPGADPHAGLQDAFIIYECIVEGGRTRMMALFKGKTTEQIGPIRSSRHYFVEYASEYDPIYTHFGWSPQAEKFIRNNQINNINGMYYDGTSFWRQGTGYHTAFTNIENIKKTATKLNYSLTGTSDTPYKYSIEPYNLKNGKEITKVNMQYSAYHNVTYNYDEKAQVFLRSQRGAIHTDRVTKKQYFAKNIIIIKVRNYNIGDGSARQELDSIGTGTGYYLTNGKYINITWKKESTTSKTYFYDLEGNEITLNDGLTFIQVVPINGSVSFTEKIVATVETE